ncbi:MAG: hypothetical protein HKO66_02730 [Saprospiraceae bacterium]|nr:hypothetical protein [Bacteroidia bacterium]NNE14592.1 hypothetical protein [Saprospiraceae bacterium]NNL91129.1 hypothetical protein [Saprospiraceae bacterium]
MKTKQLILSLLVFLMASSFFISCQNKDKTKVKTDTEINEGEKNGKEYTSAYICPMHCKGSGSDKMGKCPVCEMDYVKNEKFKTDGHNHDGHDHDGHNHDGHDHSDHNHDGHSH